MIAGIDFGAKKAGTTAIARLHKYNEIDFFCSRKDEDADKFILEFIAKNSDLWLIYIDAPLSLPKVYQEPESADNYFYRSADLATKAMSPMFLGGLTARAMKLKAAMEKKGIKVVETYPSELVNQLGFSRSVYKKKLENIPVLIDKINELFHWDIEPQHVLNWHYFDALLCLASAKRHEQGKSTIFGEEDEGQIIV